MVTFSVRSNAGHMAPRLLCLGNIKSIEGATDETITRNHVQESAREKNPTASHDLQALRYPNLFTELFESSSRSSRQKNSLTVETQKRSSTNGYPINSLERIPRRVEETATRHARTLVAAMAVYQRRRDCRRSASAHHQLIVELGLGRRDRVVR